MAREITDLANTTGTSVENPYGRVRNASSPGATDNTQVTEEMLGDVLVLMQKIMDEAGITPNGNNDSSGNDFQLYEALTALIGILGLPDNSVTNAKMADNAIGTNELISLAVTGAKLASNAVSSIKIADGAVVSAKIDSLAVTTSKIQLGAVTTEKLFSAAVTAVKIADNAITTAKIADNAITTAKIGAGQVISGKIATGGVANVNLASNAVTVGKISDGAVSLAKLSFSPLVNEGNSSGNSLINTKVIEIGDWNMDATASISVAHGLSDYKKIRSVDVVIRNDADTSYSKLDAYDIGVITGGVGLFDASNISIVRNASSFFDSPNYDSTSFNRGWVTIIYES